MIFSKLKAKQIQHQEMGLLRERLVIDSRRENVIVTKHSSLINFCSSDYLGLTHHPEIIKTFKQGVDQYGCGSGSSALICGHFKANQVLEEQFADFLGREAALLFNCGYLANLGVIKTLATTNTDIIADRLCHASLIDAIQSTRSKHLRYRHNDIDHLQQRLQQSRQPDKLIITESVFSMEGDIADLKQITHAAQQHKADLIVDDAHGIGILGNNGAGICEQFQLSQQQVPILIVPLGKAFAGFGAIVAGSKAFITALMQFARTYMYTTALPPAIAHALITTLSVIKQAQDRRMKLFSNIQYFINAARERGISIQSHALTPIKSILIGSNHEVLKLQKIFNKHGFLVSAIRPPSVPAHTARLRISLNYFHTEQQINDLLDILAEFLC